MDRPRPRIYLSPPHMCGEERRFLLEAFDSNWIAPLGPQVDAFEREVCARLGVSHALAVSSGTAALHLALLVLGVERGDEVWCSTLTFAASANPIFYCGATPVFFDCDETTWNIDPRLVEDELARAAARGRLPKALVAADLYGQCADYDRLRAACDPYGIPIVEDAAEALGAVHRGRAAGALGDLGILSFNGNKIITTSGGGMLLSNRKDCIERARHLATQARDPAPHYEHSSIGYNYRLSNLLAAVGRGQLRVLDGRVERRRAINRFYRERLGRLPGIRFMPEAPYGRSTFWLTAITVDPEAFGATREDIRLTLEAANIESRPVWKPLHLQKAFAGSRSVGGRVSERLFEQGLCLPSGSSLSQEDLEGIAGKIEQLCPEARL